MDESLKILFYLCILGAQSVKNQLFSGIKWDKIVVPS